MYEKSFVACVLGDKALDTFPPPPPWSIRPHLIPGHVAAPSVFRSTFLFTQAPEGRRWKKGGPPIFWLLHVVVIAEAHSPTGLA